MKIYFGGSMSGGRGDAAIYAQIIAVLQELGHEVLTEHVGNVALTEAGETDKTKEEIFARDVQWLGEADAAVMEITQHSTGVGYEVGRAEARGIPILCLFRDVPGKRPTPMILGNPNPLMRVYKYAEPRELRIAFRMFERTMSLAGG
jgi:2'-deoxynucleoside 5'-phosphate N-hydrolase